jgi:sugar lactone lactonase YvrE
MAGSLRLHRVLTLATTALLAATMACSAPTPSAADAPSAGPAPSAQPTPIAVYTLDQPEHRTPVPIEWDAERRSFFVGTWHDGTLYRGNIADPTVRVFLEGQPGQAASGLDIADGRLYVAGGMYREIRAYDLETRSRVGTFGTASDGTLFDLVVTDAGDVWVTDAINPVLWHLTPERVAAGTGTATPLPLTPEIPHLRSCDNLEGIVALSDTRLVAVKFADGTLYRIDLDPQAPEGRTITPIAGVTVPLGNGMTLDGDRLLIADDEGVSVVELSDDATRGTVVARLRDPSFRDTAGVARVDDRYLVVNAAWNRSPPDHQGRGEMTPYTVSSVPAVP